MKRLLGSICVAFALLLPISAILTGCKTPTAQRQAFNSVYSVGAAVDASYRAYLDLVISGQLKTNSVPSVSAYYNAFQNSFRAASLLVVMNTNVPPTADLITRAALVTSKIEAAKKEDK